MTTFCSMVAFEKLKIPCDLGEGEWWNHWLEAGGDVCRCCFGNSTIMGIFQNADDAKKIIVENPETISDIQQPYIFLCEYEFGLSPAPSKMYLYKWNDENTCFDEVDASYLEHIGFFGFMFY